MEMEQLSLGLPEQGAGWGGTNWTPSDAGV